MTRAAERAPLLPTTASAKASTRAVGAATSAGSMMTAISIEGVDGAGDGADVASRRARGNARGVKVALVIGSAAAVCAVAFAGVSVRGHETRVAGLGRFRLSHARRAALAKHRRHERVEERHAEARAENARALEASRNVVEREEGEDTVSDVQKMIQEAIARVRGAVQAGEAVDASKGSTGKDDGLPALEFDVRHYVKQSDDDGARVEEKKADDGEDKDRGVRAEVSKGDGKKRSKKHKREDDEDEEDSDSDEDDVDDENDDDDDARKSRALVRKQLVNADETFAKVEFTPYKTKRVSADVRARADEKLAELAEASNELLSEIQQRMNMRIEAIERDASEAEDVDERVRAQQVAAEKIEELQEEVRKRVVVIKQKTAMRAAAIKDEIEAEIEDKNDDTAQLAKDDDAKKTTDEDDERKLTPHIIEANIDALKKQIEKEERVKENIIKAKKRVEDNAEDLSDHQRKRREAVEDRQERIEDDNAKEKKNKEAREDRQEEHEDKREAAEDEATAAMVATLKELRVALAEATDKPLSDIVKKFDVPSTLEKLKENKKEADHEAKDAKEDAAYEEKIDSLKQRIKELEDRLDDALNENDDTAQLAKGDDAKKTTDEDDERKLTPHIIEANIDALKKQIEKEERVKENIIKAKKRVEDNAEDLSDHQRKRREAVEDRQERIEDDNAKEKKNKEAREDRQEEHEDKREAAEDEATAAMVATLKELRVALAEATDKPLSDIVKKFDVPSTLEKLKENKKEADHEAKDAKEDAAYEEKIDSLKQRIKELEDRLDDALNGHDFDNTFFRKRPVGLEPDFPAEHSYDESGGFFQCEEKNKCMTKVTLYKHNGKLYGMKGHCEKGTKATDLGTGEHEVFPKHAEFDFSAEQCNVNFDKHYRSLYIRREGDDVIAMSTDGTPATRCGLDIPSATSVKFECQNPKACITGFHVKNRYTNIDGSVERTAEDLSISDVDFVCSDGHYAVDPVLQRDDYGEITVTPQFTVGVAHTPSSTGTRKTVMPYLQLKTHSVVSATVGQANMLVTQIRDITHMSDEHKTGWCTTQHAQAWLNAAPSCPDGSKLCAKPSFLYNPTGSEYRLKYGHQLFNVTSAETHESTHIVLTNNEDPALDGHLPVKANEEFFKFGHVYEICASAVDYSGFSSNITNDAGEILGTMAHRRLDGDARFVGLSHTGERSISMKGGSRHYIAHAPEAPTDEELERLGCAGESSSCVISGGGVKLSNKADNDDKAAESPPTTTKSAATGYNEDMKIYYSMPSSNFDPLAELSESERAKIIAKQSEETLSARERLEQQLAARGVNIDLDVHEK